MCGIVAVYYTATPSADRLCTLLHASLSSIEHHGPSGVFTTPGPDARLGLGHVRLSIIDLETGNQPLSDEDDLIHCVVAGEIYEYEPIRSELEAKGSVFKTKSLSHRATDAPNSWATVEEMIETLREHLFHAIELRLRSDVPT
ncbi:hypothetical protein FB451DRAFT_1405734 [Mycena latifolia]|nr:hypothetical protein FB451DRAFT_1405734 [Mycena latifolia]